MQADLYHYGSLHINILLWAYPHQPGHIYITNYLKVLQKSGTAIIYTSHNPNFFEKLGGEVDGDLTQQGYYIDFDRTIR